MPGHESVTAQTVEDGGERFLEPGHETDGDARFWALRSEFLPYSYPVRTGDMVSVLR